MSLLAYLLTLPPVPLQTVPAAEALTAPLYSSLTQTAVDSADVDGDGDLDMLFSSLTPISGTPLSLGEALIYLNDGTGALVPAPQLSPGVGFGTRPRFGDFDGDGSVDLLRLIKAGQSGVQVQVLVQGPGGKYVLAPGYTYTVPSVSSFTSLQDVDSACAGDFDGDGVDELAIAYTIQGSGPFQGQVNTWFFVFHIVAGNLIPLASSAASGLKELSPFDIDNDGIPEIASFFPTLKVYRLTGGALQLVTGPAAPPPLVRPSRIDWDGDGDVDLLEVSGDTWNLLRNDLTSSVGGWTPVPLASPAAVAGIQGASFIGEAAADLDGNGHLELLVGPTTESLAAADHALVEFDPLAGSWELVWRARFTPLRNVQHQFSRQCSKQAPFGHLDMDGDGQVERAIGQYVFFEEPTDVARETELLAAGASLPAGAGTDLSALSAGYAAARDLEGDGDLDLLFDPLAPAQLGLHFLENDASGELSFGTLKLEGQLPGNDYGTPLLAAEDFTADGRMDLLVGVKHPATGAVLGAALFRGLGSGAFGDPQDAQLSPALVTRLATARCLTLRHGDLDGDGRTDLITPELILRTRSDGSFEVLVDQVGFRGQGAGDLDGNGDAEVLHFVGNQLLAVDFLFDPQSAGGSFLGLSTLLVSAASVPYGTGSAARLVDLDGDGRAEIGLLAVIPGAAAPGTGALPLTVFGLDATGSSFSVLLNSYAQLSPLQIADLDGDGAEELLGFHPQVTFVLSGQTLSALSLRQYWRGTSLVSPGPITPVMADFDGDGDAEFLEPHALIDGTTFTGPQIGSRLQYGDGAPGLGAVEPVLGVSGVLRPGAGGATLKLVRGIGGGAGLLGIGSAAVDLPLLPGVSLYIDPLSTLIPIALSGPPGAAGEGSYLLALDPVLPVLAGLSFTAQALLFDQGGPAGFSTSNGLQVNFGL